MLKNSLPHNPFLTTDGHFYLYINKNLAWWAVLDFSILDPQMESTSLILIYKLPVKCMGKIWHLKMGFPGSSVLSSDFPKLEEEKCVFLVFKILWERKSARDYFADVLSLLLRNPSSQMISHFTEIQSTPSCLHFLLVQLLLDTFL